MKTALCLYGQPRDAQVKSRQIIDNVVNPNNCDVFFHTWYDNNDLSLHKMTPGHENRQLSPSINNYLVAAYQPKIFQVDAQKKFYHKNFTATEENIEACWGWSRGYDRKEFIENKTSAIHSMWYSIMSSIRLKEEYSHANNFVYDCVILSRFDVCPDSKVDVSQYDLKNIITRNYDYPRDEVSDWFLFSSNSNMNILGSIFYYIDYHYQNIKDSPQKIWTNEAFIREHIKIFNIKSAKGNFDVTF